MFTKRHHKVIADILNDLFYEYHTEKELIIIRNIINKFAKTLQADNVRFNKELFISKCKGE